MATFWSCLGQYLVGGNLRDARGQKRPCVRMKRAEWPLTGPALPAGIGERTRVLAVEMHKRRVGSWRYYGVVLAVGLAPVVVSSIVMNVTLFRVAASPIDARSFIAGLVVALGMMVLVVLPLGTRLVRHRLGPDIREAVLDQGFCPSCAYRLEGVPPEADGCTVCPECGGAWRVSGGASDGGRHA